MSEDAFGHSGFGGSIGFADPEARPATDHPAAPGAARGRGPARGALTLPVDVHTMAYALVRIAEWFLYADAIAGERPDLEKAEEILRLVLR